jgi:hypothetical protein
MSVPKPPPHPVDQLVTWQLRDYRTALESALPDAPEGSADRTLIQRRLAEVAAEQEARTAATGLPATWANASL